MILFPFLRSMYVSVRCTWKLSDSGCGCQLILVVVVVGLRWRQRMRLRGKNLTNLIAANWHICFPSFFQLRSSSIFPFFSVILSVSAASWCTLWYLFSFVLRASNFFYFSSTPGFMASLEKFFLSPPASMGKKVLTLTKFSLLEWVIRLQTILHRSSVIGLWSVFSVLPTFLFVLIRIICDPISFSQVIDIMFYPSPPRSP